jgi:hypothetical protein
MAGGRPTKYRPEYCDLAETILAGDNPWCEVARVLQVCENTLDRWKKKYPEFCSAYERGRAAGCAVFMRKVNAAAWDADKHHVNNGLITLMAVNKYKMVTAKSEGKKKVDMSGTLSLADAVRLRHEAMASSLAT